jgi:hypothetical protein
VGLYQDSPEAITLGQTLHLIEQHCFADAAQAGQ